MKFEIRRKIYPATQYVRSDDVGATHGFGYRVWTEARELIVPGQLEGAD
jgi:hypothetical protein